MKRAAVLGHPIAHSLSPELHRAAYSALGLDWTYDAIDVTEDRLAQFLVGLDGSWAGLSLTMPLKQTVMPLLDSVSDTAARVGAANTVVFARGMMMGHNTDVAGIVSAIEPVLGDRFPESVAVIGSGSTAAAAVVAAGHWRPRELLVCARRTEAARSLLERVGAGPGHADVTGHANVVDWAEAGTAFEADVVVATLPGDAAGPLSDVVRVAPGILLDVTYDPWPTTLAAAWSQRGGVVVPGHEMLLWQAVRQVELMTGMTAPAAAMRAAITRP